MPPAIATQRRRLPPWQVCLSTAVVLYFMFLIGVGLFPGTAQTLGDGINALSQMPFGLRSLKVILLLLVVAVVPLQFLGGAWAVYSLCRGRAWGLIGTFAVHLTLVLTAAAPYLALYARDDLGSHSPRMYILARGLLVLIASSTLLLSRSTREYCGLEQRMPLAIALRGFLLGVLLSALYFSVAVGVAAFGPWLRK